MSSVKTIGGSRYSLAIVVTGIVFYLLGSYGTRTGQAQAEGPSQAGTYQISTVFDHQSLQVQVFLLDTRTGEVKTSQWVKTSRTNDKHTWDRFLPTAPR
jgi:hypothetical protein